MARERAFRYCQHDVGHALGSMRFAAAALGWKLRLLDGVGSATISQLLGLDREADYDDAEREHPELVALVIRDRWAGDGGFCLSNESASQVSSSRWYGAANVLSPKHGIDWPVIDEVARATTNSGIEADEEFSGFPSEEELFAQPIRSGAFTAEQVILGRRSAVSMDGATAISAATFFRMMARLVPTRDGQSMPWDALPWRPRIHLGLFVHRVNGLSPGLYVLARDPERRSRPSWKRCGRVPVAYALRRVRMAFHCSDRRGGLPCVGRERLLRSRHCGGRGLEPWDDRRIHGQFGCDGAGFYRNLFWGGRARGRGVTSRRRRRAFVRPGSAATSMIRLTRCSASHRAIGRASTISLWVVQSRMDALPRCLRTTWGGQDEHPTFELDRPSAASITTLDVDSPMMRAPER